ncbi:hypothetical protein J4421_02075 [Candidatus Woesearchaeota archaeon]|nr:hypothetical protein [Candidatus Woesearchaeota archaeon]
MKENSFFCTSIILSIAIIIAAYIFRNGKMPPSKLPKGESSESEHHP